MPVMNMESYLPSVLESLLLACRRAGVEEVIAVDNGSQDRSVEILQSTGVIQVLHQPVRGAYAARNHGIRHSKGEILFFLDPDCRPSGEWLSAGLEAFADPGTVVLLGKRNYGNQGRLLSLLASYENTKARWMISNGDATLAYGYTNNMAVRRSALEGLGLFEERARGADTLFVQNVVQDLGLSAVGFCDRMEVEHLEINGVGAYYRKRAIYGGSNAAIALQCQHRSISAKERLCIGLAVIRERRLPPGESWLLFMILCFGSLIYDWNHCKAKWGKI